ARVQAADGADLVQPYRKDRHASGQADHPATRKAIIEECSRRGGGHAGSRVGDQQAGTGNSAPARLSLNQTLPSQLNSEAALSALMTGGVVTAAPGKSVERLTPCTMA